MHCSSTVAVYSILLVLIFHVPLLACVHTHARTLRKAELAMQQQ
jgi:hypothetical protein